MPQPSGRYAYMVNVINGVRAMGGAAAPQQVYDWLEREGHAVPLDLVTIQTDGGTRFRKEVRWARQALFDAGLLATTAEGLWSLTPGGQLASLTIEQARAIVRIRGQAPRNSQPPDLIELEAVAVSSTPLGQNPLRPTTGPIPSSWTGVVSRTVDGPASTYLMQFGERDIWKIGYAASLADRLADLNRHVPHEVLGEQWRLCRSQAWPNAILAYQMEQALLGALTKRRTIGERLRCDETEITALWSRIIS